MSFSSLIAALDRTVLTKFGSKTVTVHPQSGDLDSTVSCVVKNPVMEEDFVPGSASSADSTTNLILFVRPDADPPLLSMPVKGDTASYGGADYNVDRVGADREGGVTLYLKKRTERWDR